MQIGVEYSFSGRANSYFLKGGDKKVVDKSAAIGSWIDNLDEYSSLVISQMSELLEEAESGSCKMKQSFILGNEDERVVLDKVFPLNAHFQQSCLIELGNLAKQKKSIELRDKDQLANLIEFQTMIHDRRYRYCSALVVAEGPDSISPAGIWKTGSQLVSDASEMMGEFRSDKAEFLATLESFRPKVGLSGGGGVGVADSGGSGAPSVDGVEISGSDSVTAVVGAVVGAVSADMRR